MSGAHLECQEAALAEVGALLKRWEKFRALFPSTRAMKELLKAEYSQQLQ